MWWCVLAVVVIIWYWDVFCGLLLSSVATPLWTRPPCYILLYISDITSTMTTKWYRYQILHYYKIVSHSDCVSNTFNQIKYQGQMNIECSPSKVNTVSKWVTNNLKNIHLWIASLPLWDQLVTNQTCHFHRVYSIKILQLDLLCILYLAAWENMLITSTSGGGWRWLSGLASRRGKQLT